MKKMIYSFGNGTAEGSQKLSGLLGGKGANLAEMSRLGVRVPPGFTITTEVCKEYFSQGDRVPAGLDAAVREAMRGLESALGRRFGDAEDPLLVSVRSGSPVSMPGMMETVLNLGLTRVSVEGLIRRYGNERFAWDIYRRFLQMFGSTVLHVPDEEFRNVMDRERKEAGIRYDSELSASTLKRVAGEFLSIVEKHTGKPFGDDPWEHLRLAIEAVFSSWNMPKARTYRKLNNIPGDLGTAVNVQAMVFGNRGDECATGVVFSRDPSTGKHGLIGEYLVNAQGEDVVAGIATPGPLNENKPDSDFEGRTMKEWRFDLYDELERTVLSLEKHYGDMQDVEFTVEEGRLWILQTRSGKRTAHASLRIAVDMVEEGLIDKPKAVLRLNPASISQLLHPVFDPRAKKKVLARGLAASPGAVSGKAVFTAEDAEAWAKRGDSVILVRRETSPEDVHGMHAALGVLTARGGLTSHAAVVARGMGRCCVSGCSEIEVDESEKFFVTKGGKTIREGVLISLDGNTGEVIEGALPTVEADVSGVFGTLLAWADEYRKMSVRANADTPEDCSVARRFGAEGVGLCRTEHMFFAKDRIDTVRQMILAETKEDRERFLSRILPMQLEDFVGIFRVMNGLPVTIRLLDPPLHEFLPHTKTETKELAERIGADEKWLIARVDSLREFNPMLGHRGCRLAVTFPEIYDMQVRAIMRAACTVEKEDRSGVIPEIMIPLVAHPKELEVLRARALAVAEEVKGEFGSSLDYTIGTMIELPRAAISAAEIAEHADFFSFGTNDLTQTVFGLSRDDAGRFLPTYLDEGILPADPFSTIDVGGVLELVRWAAERGRSVKPDLKLGVCGEHGGDPDSIAHFHRMGLSYVSASPYRVPVARLKAAQLEILKGADPVAHD